MILIKHTARFILFLGLLLSVLPNAFSQDLPADHANISEKPESNSDSIESARANSNIDHETGPTELKNTTYDPATFLNQTNIPGTESATPGNIYLLDIDGNIIHRIKRTGGLVQFDASELPKGLYYLCIHQSDGVVVRKIQI